MGIDFVYLNEFILGRVKNDKIVLWVFITNWFNDGTSVRWYQL